MGTLIGMIQQDEIGRKGGLLEKRGQRRMECRAQGQGLTLHQSGESSCTVNMGMQSMGAEKWVDVVEGVWKNLHCLKVLSEVRKKS